MEPIWEATSPQTTQATASILTGINHLELIDHVLPPPEPNELQIAIKATGLCGSDLKYHSHFSVAGFPVLEPLTLGHESAGIISALGSSIALTHPDFKVGDRVALEVGVACHKPDCDRCREGRYNICPELRFRSSARSVPYYQGTLQEKLNHPARHCYKLPESVSLEEGALVEPLSVAIHAARRSGILSSGTEEAEELGVVKACLVLGAGTIGLMTAAGLRVAGVKTIVVADVDEGRVGFTVEQGFADRGIVVERSGEESVTIEERLEKAMKVATRTGKEFHWGTLEAVGEFDVVFECTGVESCAQTAIYATRSGGKVLLVGIGSAVQTIPIAAAAQREVDLIGVFRYASTYKDGIEMIAAANEGIAWEGAPAGARSLPDLKKLITHRFTGLKNVKDAFEMASRRVDKEGKLVLTVVIRG